MNTQDKPRLQPHIIAEKVAIAVTCARLKRELAAKSPLIAATGKRR